MKFTLTTTAQVETDYLVEADDQDQAKKRLRIHIADAESLRPGVVTRQAAQRYKTPERIIGANTENADATPADD